MKNRLESPWTHTAGVTTRNVLFESGRMVTMGNAHLLSMHL